MKYKYKRKGETRNCKICGNEFVAFKWNIDKGGGKYCGHSCQTKGKNNPFWHGGRTYHKRGII